MRVLLIGARFALPWELPSCPAEDPDAGAAESRIFPLNTGLKRVKGPPRRFGIDAALLSSRPME